MTAVVLLPLAYALVFLAAPRTFAMVAALLLLIGSWEFRKLADLARGLTGWLLLAIQAGLFVVLLNGPEPWAPEPLGLMLVACAIWLAMFAQLGFYRPGGRPDLAWRVRGFLNALAVLTLGWMTLVWLRFQPAGEWLLLALLLIIWAADIGAYFAGRRFGRSKLAPRISPGKTRAGLYGGLVLASVVGTAVAAAIPALPVEPLPMGLIALLTAIASVGGDLFISMHKRTVDCKDSGRLFPGHGGVLDRLDSLLAGAPFFALGLLLAAR